MTPSDGNGLVIVADQARELGGSERVLGAILPRYPAATVFAPEFSTTNVPDGDSPPWNGQVATLGRNGPRRHFLGPVYARRLAARPLGPASVVLSLAHSGWAMAAGIPPGARHVCYNAGPPRWLYGHTAEYLSAYPGPVRPALRAAVPALRAHHRRLMRRPDRLITNSSWSATEIARLFGRSAEAIYPPVMTDYFTPAHRPRRHALLVARLVPHKRIDLAIEAFRGLDHELVVAGGGPGLERLRAGAPANVSFTGYVDDERLRELYRSSIALVCPSIEEFGIAMAEAQAAGTPVIAPRRGGALEVVRDGASGILLERVDPRSIANAVRAVRTRGFDPLACRQSAERFDRRRFEAAVGRVLEEELALAGAECVGRPARRVAAVEASGAA